MDQVTIQKIAEEVGHYLPDYRWIFAVQAVVALIAAGVGAYVGAYWRERGKNLATKADFEQLQSQLGAQTKLVETIKSDVGQRDWVAREWTNLRRVKLEELLNKASECEGYRERHQRASTAGESLAEHRDFGDDFRSLATLYFPELGKEAGAYLVLFRELVLASSKLSLALHHAGTNAIAREKAYTEHSDTLSKLSPEIVKARAALDGAARSLVVQIMGIAE